MEFSLGLVAILLICAIIASAFQNETAKQVATGLLRTSIIVILLSVIAISI